MNKVCRVHIDFHSDVPTFCERKFEWKCTKDMEFYGQTWDKLGSPVEKAWPRLLSYNFSHLGPFPSTIRLAESSVSLFTSTHPSILTHHSAQTVG